MEKPIWHLLDKMYDMCPGIGRERRPCQCVYLYVYMMMITGGLLVRRGMGYSPPHVFKFQNIEEI